MRRLFTCLAGLLAAFVAVPANAAHPIADPSGAGLAVVVNTTDDVIATYLGTSAAFSDDLYLVRPGQSDLFLFNNHGNAVGDTVNLGSFAIGTELLFKLITPIGDTWYSGDPSRNSDGLGHAAVMNNYIVPGTTLVSFEDLPGSQEFNDLSFSFTGTTGVSAVPEPATWAMMMIGFGAAGTVLRRRRRGAATFA